MLLCTVCLTVLLLLLNKGALAQDQKVVRIARLVIDSARVEEYRAYLKEEIETSVRMEAGVLTLFAVYEKNDPTRVTIMEVYANQEGYRKHLETAHFIKYKTGTKDMVRSLELVESIPIAMETKMQNKGVN